MTKETIFMLFNLPEIPNSKLYIEEMTPEQMAIDKCSTGQRLTEADILTLKESIDFYKLVFQKLKEIDLSSITKYQVEELKIYLKSVFNFVLTISNNIHFELLFRVSFVRESFLEKGKVRNPSFLGYPPLDLVKEKGVYNRANSNEKTAFYASFYENVALRETKPAKGENIIISIWKNISGKPFSSYPISNSSVKNRGVQEATLALNKSKETNHPLFAEIMDLVLGFLASEFVKDGEIKSPFKYEYLYSAFFADQILSPRIENEMIPDTDFIIYPSVAWKHEQENVVLPPVVVNKKLKLIKAIEYFVEETFYEKNLLKDEMPAKLKFIREATWFEPNLIIWEDE